MYIFSSLVIKNSKGKGRGVFTTSNIPANTTIEISPVLVFSEKESRDAEKHYSTITFLSGEKAKKNV